MPFTVKINYTTSTPTHETIIPNATLKNDGVMTKEMVAKLNAGGPTGPSGPSGTPGPSGPSGPAGGGSELVFGASDVGAAAGTRYLPPGFLGSSSIAPSSLLEVALTRAGTLKNFFVRHNSAPGNAQVVVYTVLVNGVATALTISIPANSISTDLDNVNTVPVVDGDLVTIEVTKAASLGAIGAGLVNVIANLEVA